jgi:hypothetical protein
MPGAKYAKRSARKAIRLTGDNECIDPNGGVKPESGKIDAYQKASALMHKQCECVRPLAVPDSPA